MSLFLIILVLVVFLVVVLVILLVLLTVTLDRILGNGSGLLGVRRLNSFAHLSIGVRQVLGTLDSQVDDLDTIRIGFTIYQILPVFMGLLDHVFDKGTVLAMAIVSKRVLLTALGDLVVLEPALDLSETTRPGLVQVGNVIDLIRTRIIYIKRDQLPVRGAIVDHQQAAQQLDLLDLARIAANFAHINHVYRIIVTTGGVSSSRALVRVFPGLWDRTVVANISRRAFHIGDKLELAAMLDLLLDRVQSNFFLNLQDSYFHVSVAHYRKS